LSRGFAKLGGEEHRRRAGSVPEVPSRRDRKVDPAIRTVDGLRPFSSGALESVRRAVELLEVAIEGVESILELLPSSGAEFGFSFSPASAQFAEVGAPSGQKTSSALDDLLDTREPAAESNSESVKPVDGSEELEGPFARSVGLSAESVLEFADEPGGAGELAALDDPSAAEPRVRSRTTLRGGGGGAGLGGRRCVEALDDDVFEEIQREGPPEESGGRISEATGEIPKFIEVAGHHLPNFPSSGEPPGCLPVPALEVRTVDPLPARGARRQEPDQGGECRPPGEGPRRSARNQPCCPSNRSFGRFGSSLTFGINTISMRRFFVRPSSDSLLATGSNLL